MLEDAGAEFEVIPADIDEEAEKEGTTIACWKNNKSVIRFHG